MRRRLRLAAPAIAFAAVGGVLLVFGYGPEMRLEGGFATSGAYALALQLVLASFLLAVVDDLQEPPLPMSQQGVGRFHATGRAMPADFRLALLQFYLASPLAALALSFGFASSLGVLLSGLLDGTASAPQLLDTGLARSAVPMDVLLVVTSLAQLPARRAGVLGWCVGFGVGSSLAQIQFVAGVDVGLTWRRALVIVVALVVLWGIAHGVRTARRIQPG